MLAIKRYIAQHHLFSSVQVALSSNSCYHGYRRLTMFILKVALKTVLNEKAYFVLCSFYCLKKIQTSPEAFNLRLKWFWHWCNRISTTKHQF